MKYEGQRIAVLGGGASGLAAARLAHAHGADVVLVDSGEGKTLRSRIEELRGEGINTHVGNDAFVGDPGSYSLVVVSPGIDPHSHLARHFSTAGVEL